MGASSFRGSYTAILQPHLDCGKGLRPLSFAANGNKGPPAKGQENDVHKDDGFDDPHGVQDYLENYKIFMWSHVGQHQKPLQGNMGISQGPKGAESGRRR